jgi:hypothetical protein
VTQSQPRNDFASFPAPAEGILMAMFITVRNVARSRDLYSRQEWNAKGDGVRDAADEPRRADSLLQVRIRHPSINWRSIHVGAPVLLSRG